MPCEINPLFFSGLYGVPSRGFFLYPRLMTATRPRPGTPRFDRAPFASRRACGRGAPACFPPREHPLSNDAFCVPTPLSGIPAVPERMPQLPVLLQLGAKSIATKRSRPSVTGHWPLVTDHCFYNSFRMNVYKLPFCYLLYNECLCHVPGGWGGTGKWNPPPSLTKYLNRQ